MENFDGIVNNQFMDKNDKTFLTYVSVKSKRAHPPPGQTPGLLTIFQNSRQIPGGGDKNT
jgi:hypothetical protein